MNLKNSIASILVIAIIATITFATAATIMKYLYPMQADVVGEYKAEIWFENQKWDNNTLIDWGTLNITKSPSWVMNLTVKNIGTQPFNVTTEVKNFPSGWMISWAKNNTIVDPASQASADLIITPTTLGVKNWDFYVYIEKL